MNRWTRFELLFRTVVMTACLTIIAITLLTFVVDLADTTNKALSTCQGQESR